MNALGYLLKPVRETRLAAALAKARARIAAPAETVPASFADEVPQVPLMTQDWAFVKDCEQCWFV